MYSPPESYVSENAEAFISRSRTSISLSSCFVYYFSIWF